MNSPEIVLQAIHENADLRREAIFHLRRKADGALASMLRRQQAGYDGILARSGDMLREMGVTPRRQTRLMRMAADLKLDMHTMRDASAQNLTRLLIRSASEGISDLKEELRLYPDMHPKVRALGEELIALEEGQVREWKG